MKISTILLFWVTCVISFQKYDCYAQNNKTTATVQLYSDTVEAEHYSIFISDINLTEKTIAGYSQAALLSHYNQITSVTLELSKLAVDSVFVSGQKRSDFSRLGDQLFVQLGKEINSGDTISVGVYYHGKTFVDASGWGGFHFAGDYAFNLGVGFQSVPHNLGKAWFACIDDFRDRALYDVYARVANDRKAISGGRLVNVVRNTDSLTSTWHWKTEFSLPTYLISLSTGKYELVEDAYPGIERVVPITLYCQPAALLRVAGTFVNLKKILHVFEQNFGPYPFERVGYTATAEGAMEHAANISYPYSGWSGNTQNDWWFAHELSHMWFGDMATCASAENMWLNEGWAVWCESLVREALYGKESYKANMRSKLKAVLQSTHIKDGGYYPVYGIPQSITYGNTVYEKGGQVVHTLRNYLGDSLFFGGVKSYLRYYSYQPVSSADMCNYLSEVTKVDLKPFFDTWVYSPGFPHFSIDSFSASPSGNNYEVLVSVRQRLKNLPLPGNSNHLEIGFAGANREWMTDTLVFSGITGSKKFVIPFLPVSVMADPEERMSDATTDVIKKLSTAGETEFEHTFARVVVDYAADTALVRITHNWVPPDEARVHVAGLRLSDQHYWTVEGVLPPGFRARGKFTYSRSSFDNIIQRASDSLVLLFRYNSAHDWQPAGFVKQGNWAAGTLTCDTLRCGEYTLAVWDGLFLGNEKPLPAKANSISVFPNPAKAKCTVTIVVSQPAMFQVTDTAGREINRQKIDAGSRQVTWARRCRPSATYIFKLADMHGNLLDSTKAIIQ